MSAPARWQRRMTGTHLVLATALAVSLLLAATVSVPILRAQLRHAAEVRARTEQATRTLHGADRLAHDASARARAGKLAAAIPADPSLGATLSRLRALASRSGLDWVASATAPTDATPVTVDGDRRALRTFTLTVTLTGAPAHVAAFTDAVAAAPRLYCVDALRSAGTTAVVSLRVFATPDPARSR